MWTTQAQLLAAKATLKQRSQEMDRQSALAKAKVNAIQDLQNAQDNLASSQAAVAAANAVLEAAELQLSYTEIYAPVDGYITNLNVSEGNLCECRPTTACPIRHKFILDCCLLQGNSVKKYGAGLASSDYVIGSRG
jgi:multidrug resistance efflux pump